MKDWYPITENSEIEVTLAMLRAGVDALMDGQVHEPPHQVALRIYLAMRRSYMQTHPGEGVS